jgi:hypothetical protein
MDESCSGSGRKHPSREETHDSGVEGFALAGPAAVPEQTPANRWPQPDSQLALVLPPDFGQRLPLYGQHEPSTHPTAQKTQQLATRTNWPVICISQSRATHELLDFKNEDPAVGCFEALSFSSLTAIRSITHVHHYRNQPKRPHARASIEAVFGTRLDGDLRHQEMKRDTTWIPFSNLAAFGLSPSGPSNRRTSRLDSFVHPVNAN